MMDPSAHEAKLFRFTEENYTDVFNDHWRTLYVIAYRRLRDTEVAKDIVQEVFVYCWQKRETIRISTAVEAYLRSALQYRLFAHFRKLAIQDRAYAHLYERMVAVEAHMRDILTEQDLEKTLTAELETMPATMREIFKLRIRDYSVNEIAESLNLAEKTVRNNITKGAYRLHKAVSKDFPEDFSAISLLLYVLLT